jgi:ribosome-binding ATPase YchF (GTP1/OBG family)
MWFVQILNKKWQKITRIVDSGKISLYTLLEEKLSGLSIKRNYIIEALRKTGLNIEKPSKWKNTDLYNFAKTLINISKPMLLALNKIDIPSSKIHLENLKKQEYLTIPCSAQAELVLRKASEKKLIDYKPGDSSFKISNSEKINVRQEKALNIIQEKVLTKYKKTGIQATINTAFFKLLNMIVVYTVEDIDQLSDHKGRILPDARLVKNGTTCRELAFKIHTELGESFICAIDIRTRRKRGENHVLKNRDVISVISRKKRA